MDLLPVVLFKASLQHLLAFEVVVLLIIIHSSFNACWVGLGANE
jgi:hypothetical protein